MRYGYGPVNGKLGTLATLIKKGGIRKIKPLYDEVVNWVWIYFTYSVSQSVGNLLPTET